MISMASLPSGQQPFDFNQSSSSLLAPVNSFNSLLDLQGSNRRNKDTSRKQGASRSKDGSRKKDGFRHRHHHGPRHSVDSTTSDNEIFEQATREAHRRASVRSQAEQAEKDMARSYLERFLNESEWQDHMVSIIEEAVPTMGELESYGELDESEGTRACRRMFKAVVVWEQIGHSLWEKIRDDSRRDVREHRFGSYTMTSTPTQSQQRSEDAPQQKPEDKPRRPSHHRMLGSRDLNPLSIIMEQPTTPLKSRRSSLTSLNTRQRNDDEHDHGPPSPRTRRPQATIRRSSSVPATRRRFALQADCDCCEGGVHDNERRATDPGPSATSGWSSDESEGEGDENSSDLRLRSAATFPRKLSKNCKHAVRRTFEALHDSRGRRPSAGS